MADWAVFIWNNSLWGKVRYVLFSYIQYNVYLTYVDRFHLLGGRGFVCFGVGPCTLAGSKTKHMKPQTFKRMINGVKAHVVIPNRFLKPWLGHGALIPIWNLVTGCSPQFYLVTPAQTWTSELVARGRETALHWPAPLLGKFSCHIEKVSLSHLTWISPSSKKRVGSNCSGSSQEFLTSPTWFLLE